MFCGKVGMITTRYLQAKQECVLCASRARVGKRDELTRCLDDFRPIFVMKIKKQHKEGEHFSVSLVTKICNAAMAPKKESGPRQKQKERSQFPAQHTKPKTRLCQQNNHGTLQEHQVQPDCMGHVGQCPWRLRRLL